MEKGLLPSMLTRQRAPQERKFRVRVKEGMIGKISGHLSVTPMVLEGTAAANVEPSTPAIQGFVLAVWLDDTDLVAHALIIA